MIIEVVTVLSMVVGGSALMRITGIRGWALPIVGSVAGISLYLVVGMLQVFTPITTSPVVTISLTAGLPLAAVAWQALRGADVGVRIIPSVATVLGVVAAVALFRQARLVAWSKDSFEYLVNASLIANNHLDAASLDLLPKRLIGVPLLHAAANLGGEHYLPAITPLIAGLTIAVIVWLAWVALAPRIDHRIAAVVIVSCLLALVTVNRYVFNAFYVNGHLLFGMLIVVLVGCGWLIATKTEVNRAALITLMALSIVALSVIRAEAPIAVALALLPVLLNQEFSVRERSLLLGLFGISTIAWQSFVAIMYVAGDSRVPVSVLGLLALGIAALGGVPLLRLKLLTRKRSIFLVSAQALLWVALAILAMRQPDVLIDSLRATVDNAVLGAGSWGYSLLLLGIVVAVALFAKLPRGEMMRFPIVTFIPVAFLLAYLREAAYRVGAGDSLNRMWIQLLPLAVFYLIIAIGMGRRRLVASDSLDERRVAPGISAQANPSVI
ncbi:hypothetical protein I6E68_05105 [Salinibacterium sp. NSLL150]|uniref:hypothetical protein n=1 Tax=unclassified Salinibacterium TaxID=2632331 RepID=UPI0018CDDF06|nr:MULTISPECIES: hypothetical protein [unclassified Salinibacterium]MBH0098519.1 hypothetical protein [Salinibacterium sp. NSLL35]MBH0101274.1 hypothetical protein [Salinibacterium sp. NSLL150]MBH0104033.1 hypothetical protein [Salinibacterium sp. NSLL16]MBH0106794.1 hypothetical protein [Salinibacterium sp. NSLL17]